jgi:hypothetical protein
VSVVVRVIRGVFVVARIRPVIIYFPPLTAGLPALIFRLIVDAKMHTLFFLNQRQ